MKKDNFVVNGTYNILKNGGLFYEIQINHDTNKARFNLKNCVEYYTLKTGKVKEISILISGKWQKIKEDWNGKYITNGTAHLYLKYFK